MFLSQYTDQADRVKDIPEWHIQKAFGIRSLQAMWL